MTNRLCSDVISAESMFVILRKKVISLPSVCLVLSQYQTKIFNFNNGIESEWILLYICTVGIRTFSILEFRATTGPDEPSGQANNGIAL